MMSNSKSKTGSIINSAMLLSVSSVIVLIFSFIKESVIAYFYGTSYVADAYVVAIDIPFTVFTFVSMAVSTVIIPIYSRELVNNGKDKAAYFASNFTTILFLILSIILLIAEIFAEFIIAIFSPGLATEVATLAGFLLRITLPATCCAVLCKVNFGILHSHKDFFAASLSSGIYSIVIILGIFFLNHKYGIYAAAIGTIAGAILEYVYTCVLKRKYHKYHFVLDFKNTATKDAVKMALPVCIGMGAAEINKIIDKIIASFLTTGSISALHYASKISSGLSNVLINTIATVTFPEMAECIAKRDEKRAAKIYVTTLKLFHVILIPIIIGGIWLSTEMIIIIYGRGNFEQESVSLTTPIFSWYLVCLVFTAIRQVATRLFYSYGDSNVPMKNSVIGIIINIILNIVLSKYFGAMGLAMATTLSTAIISILLMIDAKKINKEIGYLELLKSLKNIFISSLGMMITLYLVKDIALELNLYCRDDFFAVIVFTIVSIVFGASSYFIALMLLRDKDVIDFMKRLKIIS